MTDACPYPSPAKPWDWQQAHTSSSVTFLPFSGYALSRYGFDRGHDTLLLDSYWGRMAARLKYTLFHC
jgi:hypothetical protein